MVACSAENSVPMDDTRIWVTGGAVTGTFPNLQRASLPYHCMHCLEPACASACPVGAWTKRDDGPVVYDADRCIGCRYCMNACPFGVPHFDWNRGVVEQPLITKCTMCAHRLDQGQEPACVQTCLTGALKFGSREQLLAEAKSLIAAHPGKYVNHVYGETENGGTSYLIISHVPFADLGLPEVPSQSVSAASEAVMEGTLPFAFSWAVVLSAVAGLVRLRERGTRKASAGAPATAIHQDALATATSEPSRQEQL